MRVLQLLEVYIQKGEILKGKKYFEKHYDLVLSSDRLAFLLFPTLIDLKLDELVWKIAEKFIKTDDLTYHILRNAFLERSRQEDADKAVALFPEKYR